ncbi:TspO/MBR family protein [Phenylobacterium deserti]|uniref:Tryptophan-rich sensory protein n=1 Tax=Phenylobacterium deserti TaxID=1914756 RepID=A0A328ASJ6_9CAUL|nr:TspO/MBR family protein [Phenylobacterium deserti]RAK57587.1 tryptophan-rich sensory protein [Phenylobacterium deserti]
MQFKVRGAVDSLANSRGRSTRHLAVGVGLTAGAVLASALIARANAPTKDNPETYSDYEDLDQPGFKPPAPVFAWVWPPLFLTLIVSGLRIWNAPKSAARTQALSLWAAVQGLNALWMALGPKRLSAQLATAVTTLGAAGAYIWRAKKVDGPAAGLVAPYAGWIGFANVLTEELWRKNHERPTIH